MTWHHLHAAPRARSARILDESRIGDLLPGLGILESDFDVPGRGTQAAIGVDADGRPLLIETSRARVDALPAGLLDRVAWFDAHRALLPRLFGESIRGDRRPHAVIVAPGFGASLRRSGSLGETVHLLRVRALTAPTGELFAFVEPERVGHEPEAGTSEELHPFVDPTRAPGRVSDDRRARTTERATAPPTPSRSVASFRPRRRSTPDELLRRARNWLAKLSPDIEVIATDVDGRTRFLFRDQALVDVTVADDRLQLDVPERGRLAASDSHELNACMQQVITRYFSLVGSDDTKLSRLRREDILTERELAEFVPPPPEQ